MTNTFFFYQIRIPNIIWFSEITEYWISSTIPYWENLNTKYRRLFGIKKIIIPNTNSTIRSGSKIQILVTYKTFCSENMWNYSDRYLVQLFEYPNTIWGAKILRKFEYRIWILLFGLTILIVFEYRIICHTLPKDNWVHFQYLWWCLFINSWSSSHKMYAGKKM